MIKVTIMGITRDFLLNTRREEKIRIATIEGRTKNETLLTSNIREVTIPSVNIKKLLLSFLEVNLNKIKRLDVSKNVNGRSKYKLKLDAIAEVIGIMKKDRAAINDKT